MKAKAVAKGVKRTTVRAKAPKKSAKLPSRAEVADEDMSRDDPTAPTLVHSALSEFHEAAAGLDAAVREAVPGLPLPRSQFAVPVGSTDGLPDGFVMGPNGPEPITAANLPDGWMMKESGPARDPSKIAG